MCISLKSEAEMVVNTINDLHISFVHHLCVYWYTKGRIVWKQTYVTENPLSLNPSVYQLICLFHDLPLPRFCPTICLFQDLLVSRSAGTNICLFHDLPVPQSACFTICLYHDSACTSIYLSNDMPVSISAGTKIYMSQYLPVPRSTCTTIYL